MLGRLQVTLLCKSVGISLLLTIALLNPHSPHAAAYIVPLYLVRSWLMNCTAGLTKSVLNDYVPKKSRGRWNSLESINSFSWSGSAMLGGFLIDSYGYRTTFMITASLQFVSMLCLTPLLLLVQAERGAERGARGASSGQAEGEGAGGDTARSTLRDGLLAGRPSAPPAT